MAQHVLPAHLQAIAAQLYAQLLEVGYTQVCEFHYLHHAPDFHMHIGLQPFKLLREQLRNK